MVKRRQQRFQPHRRRRHVHAAAPDERYCGNLDHRTLLSLRSRREHPVVHRPAQGARTLAHVLRVACRRHLGRHLSSQRLHPADASERVLTDHGVGVVLRVPRVHTVRNLAGDDDDADVDGVADGSGFHGALRCDLLPAAQRQDLYHIKGEYNMTS